MYINFLRKPDTKYKAEHHDLWVPVNVM